MAILVFKFVTLIVRTIAKPLISWVTYYKRLKLQEQNPKLAFIKNKVVWVGQVVNYYNIKINRKLFRLSTTEPIKPLSEEKAIEKGAEFLSEFLVYSILISLPVIEWLRQNKITKENEFSKEELEKLAKENPEIKSAIAGLTVSKVITVAPKLVNFVV